MEIKNERRHDYFANIIAKKMKKANLSVGELSKLANISPSALYDILRGKENPRVNTLQEICRALGMELCICSIDTSFDSRTLVYKIMTLSDEKKHFVENVVNFLTKQ